MTTIELIPPDPRHRPAGGAPRALLYPLWVFALEIRPHIRGTARTIFFSVDGLRAIPMPVPRMPEVLSQAVPPEHRILEAIPEALAARNTRKVVRKGLGLLGSLSSAVRIVERRKVYKLYWLLPDTGRGERLVDSRSGTEVPLAKPQPGDESARDGARSFQPPPGSAESEHEDRSLND